MRAFGTEGQRGIGAAHFGIVGVGGLGAGLAISLARLGAKKFTLIDPDRAEVHNLNRLAGMTAADAKLGREKLILSQGNCWRLIRESSVAWLTKVSFKRVPGAPCSERT